MGFQGVFGVRDSLMCLVRPRNARAGDGHRVNVWRIKEGSPEFMGQCFMYCVHELFE